MFDKYAMPHFFVTVHNIVSNITHVQLKNIVAYFLYMKSILYSVARIYFMIFIFTE